MTDLGGGYRVVYSTRPFELEAEERKPPWRGSGDLGEAGADTCYSVKRGWKAENRLSISPPGQGMWDERDNVATMGLITEEGGTFVIQ